MSRIARAAAITVLAGATLFGSAGGAFAGGHHCKHKHHYREFRSGGWVREDIWRGERRDGFDSFGGWGRGGSWGRGGGWDRGEWGRGGLRRGGLRRGGWREGRRGGASARAVAIGSPGILSGNIVQVPINVQTNVCGNSVGLLGALNPSAGNVCING